MKKFHAINISIFCFTAILTFSAAAFAQTEVRVANKVGDAVAVKSVDEPARRAYSVAFAMNANPLPTVPAGKTFVIEHISGHIRVPSAFGAAGPCRFMQLSFIVGSEIDVVPVFMGTATGLNNDFNFFTISQPVRAYATQNSDIGASSFSLSQYCSGPASSSNIVLTGYLVNDSN
jgi:hypothetical protein